MISTPELPGIRFESVRKPPIPSPLRSDVAGFVGRTRRGPINIAVRVEGIREYQSVFGGLDQDEPLTYAMRGYFENGGEVAYVVRVVRQDDPLCGGIWKINSQVAYRVYATSPGKWATGLRVSLSFDKDGRTGTGEPCIEFYVQADGESIERFRVSIPVKADNRTSAAQKAFENEVARKSKLIQVFTTDAPSIETFFEGAVPRRFSWAEVVLEPSPDIVLAGTSSFETYSDAVRLLSDQPEVALVALPGLHGDDSLTLEQRIGLITATTSAAAELQDRVVLVDVIPGELAGDPRECLEFLNTLRDRLPGATLQRNVALYHPWLNMVDPLGDIAHPLRRIPPSGHVAGVISRVDRERGAHYTPANVQLFEAVDVATTYHRSSASALSDAGVNLIRCLPGKGIMVWGGRTIDPSRDGRFLAHRRFIHRLIRGVRRVAEPVVFETNGPELWLILVRAVSSILLEAFRGGALRGTRPEEAFRVRCNDKTSSLSEREQGRVFCEIDVALTAPMEFITIRVSVSREGQVEVFDL